MSEFLSEVGENIEASPSETDISEDANEIKQNPEEKS